MYWCTEITSLLYGNYTEVNKVGRKRTCELPFCHGVVEGTKNKRRCDNDRNIHLHQIISKSVKRIMRYLENHSEVTANDVNHDLFKGELDKNEKGSMYRLFQAMVREKYLVECGKKDGLKVYRCTKNDKNSLNIGYFNILCGIIVTNRYNNAIVTCFFDKKFNFSIDIFGNK